MLYISLLAMWILLLVAAAFYSRWAKHPDARPLAAYLIFALPFSATAFVIFATAIYVLRMIDRSDVLVDPAAATLFLLVVFLPALVIGHWLMRKSPGRR